MSIIAAIDRELERLHALLNTNGDMNTDEFILSLTPLHQALLEISKQIKEGNTENYGN